MNIINFISENYEWIFSGIGVSILFAFVSFRKSKREDSPVRIENNVAVNQNNGTTPLFDHSQLKESSKDIKLKTFILFIDDEKFNLVNILKQSGWLNTSSRKDIEDLDAQIVKQANIIFVDINGVGTKLQFRNQGLGLAGALKDKYPNKKIIIYSAETTGNRFDKVLQKVDYCLPKNAEPYEFIQLVDQFAMEIYEEKDSK